jgi:hypothetical protein
MRHRALLIAITAVLVSAATLATIELLARAAGHQPRRPVLRPEPVMHAPDPVLGWKPIPGQYRLGPYVPGGTPAEVTIRPDGARDSGSGPAAGRPEIVLVGCSFTFGWAVSDDQTWGWRLQERRPDVAVVNHGVGGYGTYQSLLLLEQLLGRDGQRPARVLYGFIDHGLRNVAAPIWLRMLAVTKDTVATPYCTVSPSGALERHAPEGVPSLPLHEYLASVSVLEDSLLVHRAGRRGAMARRVTELLIDEMAALCRQHGVGFSLVLLSVPERTAAAYRSYAEKHGIDVIDCNQQPTPADIVPGEAHPNGALHGRWGDCIATALSAPERLPAR